MDPNVSRTDNELLKTKTTVFVTEAIIFSSCLESFVFWRVGVAIIFTIFGDGTRIIFERLGVQWLPHP